MLPGYNFLHQIRRGKVGGGVAIYIRDCYTSKILFISDTEFDNIPEYLIVEIRLESIKVPVVVVYRRPKSHYPISLFQILSDIVQNYSNIIITGDFNFPMHCRHPDSDFFHDLISEHSLALVPSEPTHHILRSDGSSCDTWLDLFIVPSLNQVRSY